MKNIKLKVDEYEYSLIVNAVNEFRNKQIREGKTADFVTEVLTKLLKKTN